MSAPTVGPRVHYTDSVEYRAVKAVHAAAIADVERLRAERAVLALIIADMAVSGLLPTASAAGQYADVSVRLERAENDRSRALEERHQIQVRHRRDHA